MSCKHLQKQKKGAWDITGDRTDLFHFRYFMKRAQKVLTIEGFKASICF